MPESNQIFGKSNRDTPDFLSFVEMIMEKHFLKSIFFFKKMLMSIAFCLMHEKNKFIFKVLKYIRSGDFNIKSK